MRLPLTRARDSRKSDDKFAALSRPAASSFDCTAVLLDQSARYRESDTKPTVLFRGRSHEEVEDVGQVLRRDALPSVLNPN